MRWLLAMLVLAGCSSAPASTSPAPVVRAPPGWVKGQTHAHSSNSADSRTAPKDVARWYEQRGYDFVVFTDHEFVTDLAPRPGILTFRGVELTQNLRTCDPPPAVGGTCQLHMNALFVDGREIPWGPAPTVRRLDRYLRALAATRGMGGIAQLNHPNYDWSADAGVVTELGRRGVELLEIANQSGVDNDGDATHPSTEALWDIALSSGATMYGVATDDAHHYDDAGALRARGEEAWSGDLGWIMVRADRDPAAIRAAVARGDFYASTGVVLTRVEVADGELQLDADQPVQFRFVGARGRELGVVDGQTAQFPLVDESYVRAVATDAEGRMAWTQPVWAER